MQTSPSIIRLAVNYQSILSCSKMSKFPYFSGERENSSHVNLCKKLDRKYFIGSNAVSGF